MERGRDGWGDHRGRIQHTRHLLSQIVNRSGSKRPALVASAKASEMGWEEKDEG